LRRREFIAGLGCAVFCVGRAGAQDRSIIVASTTSTQDTGLFDHLLPLFTKKTGIAVRVISQGTGQALDTARRGEADVVLVHAKFLEMKFVAEGFGVKRLPVMYNDFVLVGPKTDPAGIKGMDDVATALWKIMEKQATFVSRGDLSGTHHLELRLWNRDAGVDIEKERGPWYKSLGLGMRDTLEAAIAETAHVLSDRADWLAFKNKGDLQILVEGDRRLFNQYGVILVDADRHPHVKKEFGRAFVDWLVSSEGQQAIADFKIDGEPMFYPNATDPNA
jgi:tungstate transport system substrate-binding protein